MTHGVHHLKKQIFCVSIRRIETLSIGSDTMVVLFGKLDKNEINVFIVPTCDNINITICGNVKNFFSIRLTTLNLLK
jgi:hypothetical protein